MSEPKYKIGDAVALLETGEPEYAIILEALWEPESDHLYRIQVDREVGRERVGNYPRKATLWCRHQVLEPLSKHPLL